MIALLVFVAMVIISLLSVQAWRMSQKVAEQELKQEAVAQQREKQQQEQKAYLAESIRVISMNVVNEELNLSEAVIRCKMLMDGLLMQPDERKPYDILEVVYQRIKNFDTHDARKLLTGLERQAQDAEREEVEETYRVELVSCFTKLQQFQLLRH